MTKLRTSPRLKHFGYVGPFGYSLSLVTRGRAPVFTDRGMVDAALECLALSCGRYGFSLYAYCFMPDHLHLLVCGEEDSSLTDFMRHFKQLSGHQYKLEYGAQLWQISYYDHVLRKEEDLLPLARYIWDNPVRAGLVQDMCDYPFSGPKPTMEQA
jgi:putative transposase